jgi:hypothetical protein
MADRSAEDSAVALAATAGTVATAAPARAAVRASRRLIGCLDFDIDLFSIIG